MDVASSSGTAEVQGTPPVSPSQRRNFENKPAEWHTMWAPLHEAYIHTWHTQLREASDIVGDRWKTNLWYAIEFVEIALWDYNYGESKEAVKNLETRLDHLEKISDSRADKHKPSFFGPDPPAPQLSAYIEGLVGLAYSHMARGMVRFRKHSYVKGAYSIRKSWVTLKDAYEALQLQQKLRYPEEAEISGTVYFGMGLFNFLVSLVPPNLQFIVKLLGFEGDRAAAVRQLEQAVQTGCIKRIESTLLLFCITRFFTDDEEVADQMLDELLQEFPDSPLILYLSALMFRFKGQLDRSIALLHHSLTKVAHEQMKYTLHYHLGTTYMMVADYESASQNHATFVENTTGEQFKIWSQFQLGLCKWQLTRDKDQTTPWFKAVLEKGKSDQPLDKIAMRKAKEYMKAGESFSEYETRISMISHIHEARHFSKVLTELKACRALAQTVEQKAICEYYRASSYNGLKNFPKAQKYYQKVLAVESAVKLETYIIPYTWAELGEIELELGNYPKAKEYFKKAKKYENYDWDNLLSVRIAANMDKMTRRDTAAKLAAKQTAANEAANGQAAPKK